MGCSVLSVNVSVGYNSSPSSLSVTLVEDTANGDSFVVPDIPSIWSFSLPAGGVGAPIFYDSIDLNPTDFNNSNVPFYFCGICTNWSAATRDIGGRTISVSLTDVREILGGVQCLLNGFALSQNIGAGTPRYTGVDNIVDIFGYYNYGLESGRNEYGIHWDKIKDALEACRVRLYDMYFEFYFTGDTFNDAPSFYRINDDIIDVISLVQKVCQDSGSDFVTIARQCADDVIVVEFRGIQRLDTNPLTQQEINNFITARDSIVSYAKVGREHKNEPTSNVIIGGMKNSNYVAYPAEYKSEFHLTDREVGEETVQIEDYNAFPSDIKIRLFGGTTTMITDNPDGTGLTSSEKTYTVNSGAIYPCWGFMPDDYSYPLIEPFLPLDHLVFDKTTATYAEAKGRIPLCRLDVQMFPVRQVVHNDVFLEGDGDSDERPFAYLAEYSITDTDVAGWTRGLPLNTEVLRASLHSQEVFWNIYRMYYPEIAEALSVPMTNFSMVLAYVNATLNEGFAPDLRKLYPQFMIGDENAIEDLKGDLLAAEVDSKIAKSATEWAQITEQIDNVASLLRHFRVMLHELVREYALQYMGKKFIVCLPKSAIMQRIWGGLEVPTRVEKPEIEYVVDQRGFWETIPTEFDGLDQNGTPSSGELEIRSRFMMEDGRFISAAAIDWKPQGNINFNSNNINKIMFQSIPVTEFRPNKFASGNPEYVFVTCTVNQLIKRPDLALVELPRQINFDPTDANADYMLGEGDWDDENLASRQGVLKYLFYFFKRNPEFILALYTCSDALEIPYEQYAKEVMEKWAEQISLHESTPFKNEFSTEFLMDLKAVVIPLTSTWVSYGPWYADYASAQGVCRVEVDQSLVPWNYYTPQDLDPDEESDEYTAMERLDLAGQERLGRTISDIEYMDTAVITVAGFPEYGPASKLGFNSNLTTISVDFGIGGINTTYNFATYSARPGTFRKAEYDNLSKARIETRSQLHEPLNVNLMYNIFGPGYYGTNQFKG